MGNNQNQAFGRNLAGIMIHLQGITTIIDNPDGFTFDPDPVENEKKKKEFVETMNRPENIKNRQEMKDGMERVKELMKQINKVNQANHVPGNQAHG